MEYVIVYAKPVNLTPGILILLVLKNKPEFQKNKLNLPGGKVEEGETPIQAAERELFEEAGLRPCAESSYMGRITGTWGNVHCVCVPVFEKKLSPGPGETEIIAWMDYKEVINHELLIPNLRVIIPMMATGVKGWVIHDEGPSWQEPMHNITIQIPSHHESS